MASSLIQEATTRFGQSALRKRNKFIGQGKTQFGEQSAQNLAKGVLRVGKESFDRRAIASKQFAQDEDQFTRKLDFSRDQLAQSQSQFDTRARMEKRQFAINDQFRKRQAKIQQDQYKSAQRQKLFSNIGTFAVLGLGTKDLLKNFGSNAAGNYGSLINTGKTIFSTLAGWFGGSNSGGMAAGLGNLVGR